MQSASSGLGIMYVGVLVSVLCFPKALFMSYHFNTVPKLRDQPCLEIALIIHVNDKATWQDDWVSLGRDQMRSNDLPGSTWG